MPRSRRFLAESLSSHIESSTTRRGRIRRRVVSSELPTDSPGRLYTYFSAGSLELPEREQQRRGYVTRSPRLAILLAIALVIVYCLF
ncbi:MAG: hypothetical protein ACI4QT_09295 [Kiritimatiellia bacterium]